MSWRRWDAGGIFGRRGMSASKLPFGGSPYETRLNSLFPEYLSDPHPGDPYAWGDLLGCQPLCMKSEHLPAA